MSKVNKKAVIKAMALLSRAASTLLDEEDITTDTKEVTTDTKETTTSIIRGLSTTSIATRRGKGTAKLCQICGIVFTSVNGRKICASDECESERKRRYARGHNIRKRAGLVKSRPYSCKASGGSSTSVTVHM